MACCEQLKNKLFEERPETTSPFLERKEAEYMDEMSVEKLWNKHYILVLVVNTLNAFSFYMVATILSKYLVGIGTTLTLAGFIVGLFSLTSLVCRPFSGIMADRLNNVTLLKWSNVLMCIGLLGFTVTTSIPLLILFRIINGIGFALSGTCQMALGTKYIPKNRMGEGVGYLGLGMVVGSAVAPGIGIAIADHVGMKITFVGAAALTVVAFVILFVFHEEKHPATGKKIALHDIFAVDALPYTYVAGMFSFTNGIIASYLLLYADELGVKGISVYYTVYAVVLFIIRPLSGKLMDQMGIRVTVIPGILITAASMVSLGFVKTLPLILVTAVFRAIGQGSAQPSLQAGCIRRVGKDRSGVATSTYYLGGDICQGFGPMIGGAIVGLFTGIQGYQAIFSLCAVLLVIACVYFYFYTGAKHENNN